MSQDFHDMLYELRHAGVEFLVVGAHALGVHGIIRGTLDFDIWVRPSEDNARRIWAALTAFGAPLAQVENHEFAKAGLVYQIGVTPNRIDLMNSITGVAFEKAWENRVEASVFGVDVYVIGRNELIQNKRATNRPKDQEDVKDLENDRTR